MIIFLFIFCCSAASGPAARTQFVPREHSGSVVECFTQDRRAAGSSLIVPSVTLSPKPLDQIQPNLVCELLT